jgi:hypothetical protein
MTDRAFIHVIHSTAAHVRAGYRIIQAGALVTLRDQLYRSPQVAFTRSQPYDANDIL